VVIYNARHTQTAALGHALQARCQVDRRPIDALLLHHDITQMEAYTEHHLTVAWERRVPRRQGALDSDSTLHGLHHTGKLGQQVVARIVHYPAPILLDKRCHDAAIGS
jgi:hypothetical protein